MKCHFCKQEFSPGDHAHVQEIKSIKVVGTRVRTKITEVVVCTNCAK